MIKKSKFNLQFSGLKLGVHHFNFQIEDSFFEEIEFEEIQNVDATINVNLEKKESMLILDFNLNGSLDLSCDLCTDIYSQAICNRFHLIVRFSDLISEQDNEELLILPTNEHTLSLDDYFYELIVLSIPNKRVHPEIEQCNKEMINQLERLTAIFEEKDEEIDPRWADLKKLKS